MTTTRPTNVHSTTRARLHRIRVRLGIGVVTLGLAGAGAWVSTATAGPEPVPDRLPAVPAAALDGYTVEVSPAEVVPGQTVQLTVGADDVTDLYAYDLGVTYDPAALAYVADSATTELTGATYDLLETGRVDVVHTELGTSPATTGEVVLAELTFEALEPGATSIDVDELVTVTTDNTATTTTDVGTVPVTVQQRPAPAITTAARIVGPPRVGATLSVTGPTYNVAGVASSYRWLRDGKPIAGAVSRSYAVRPADVRRRLSVAITGTRPGYVSATTAAGPTTRVVPALTTITATLLPAPAKAGRQLRVQVEVDAPGIVPRGRVRVTLAPGAIRNRSLTAGRAEAVVGGRAAGTYRLVVRFLPAPGFASSGLVREVRVRP